MTTAIAAFCRWFSKGTTHARLQNFFIDRTVNGHRYLSFVPSQIEINRRGDSSGISLQFPAKEEVLDLGTSALDQAYLVEVTIYEIDATNKVPTDLSNATIVSQFLGEVQGMDVDLMNINITVSAALDAISGDIPGRKITTSLVGRLPTL